MENGEILRNKDKLLFDVRERLLILVVLGIDGQSEHTSNIVSFIDKRNKLRHLRQCWSTYQVHAIFLILLGNIFLVLLLKRILLINISLIFKWINTWESLMSFLITLLAIIKGVSVYRIVLIISWFHEFLKNVFEFLFSCINIFVLKQSLFFDLFVRSLVIEECFVHDKWVFVCHL